MVTQNPGEKASGIITTAVTLMAVTGPGVEPGRKTVNISTATCAATATRATAATANIMWAL